MTVWAPPASTALSSTDVQDVVDALTTPHSRPHALTFTATLGYDHAYVVACETAYRHHRQKPPTGHQPDWYAAWVRQLLTEETP